MNRELLRSLPKTDELLENEKIKQALKSSMRNVVVQSLRDSIDFYRKEILEEKIEIFTTEEIIDKTLDILESKNSNKLKKVINATGTVIHTNLGRSILCKKAIESVISVAENYNNLEYELSTGKRGSRYSHIEELLTQITGAESALVVNNNAAAVMLVLDTLCKEKEAIVSRGELVEIGGSFRVPEVMRYSGATLVEVGTTNRTHIYDYENNITDNTGVLLKVHTSNYRILGFTETVPLEELVKLGDSKEIPVVEDIGSGVLIDFSKYGFTYEPTIQESIKKGVDVVTFSGDKMLGGPQCGIVVGKKKFIEKMKKNQITRALRVDKMTLAALEATIKYYQEEKEAIENIPTLNMLLTDKLKLKKDSMRLKRRLTNKIKKIQFKVEEDYSMVGGGSMPTETISTYVIKANSEEINAEKIEKFLREYKIPIIVRVYGGEVIMDIRTLFEKDFSTIVDAYTELEKTI
ncbi:L-seryl-tRNA(Sec) selenium transferase [Hathewaya histolytica]|uniref:L-seryl-tRNA(Sec) selenium transferase n=1 Tax=Hathewaya histolytica TaxID=1498 RepID=A0A4U9RPG5_HATHI|nr:L-seryl-tRNA(Sec) selenium transferase [Hathewaya histolytica]VTQ90760.1 L-seryl-tRNA(Sec) selenium transferase [Hathewaya histolytica]